MLARSVVTYDLADQFFSGSTLRGRFFLGFSPLDRDIAAGRELFYSAVDPEMSAAGAGVSCSTCHFGGRNDGLSWTLEDGDRQTPSLAGGIAETAPFTWTNGVPSVTAEALSTSSNRMGGSGLSDESVTDLAAYIETFPAPDLPDLDSGDASVERGRALFDRSDVGCADCHAGALYTDNRDWPLFGLGAVNTPPLRRIAATAPYLHDGRAETLRDVLELSMDGSMGDTSMLSEAKLQDLEAFLRSI
jgi:cytochrome c peroxidase